MAERLDIILFGATGFTGKYCIGEIHRLTKTKSLTWGIAGRSEEKLIQVLVKYQKQIGEDLNHVPVIIADINNEESINAMTASAKLVINCCGPFRMYGEIVVKSCIETGTHQIDVTGEPQYMETIQLKYHKAAMEKGVYIVSACGCDSIPSDLGLIFLQKHFKGTLNSVETYFHSIEEEPKVTGPEFNYATWKSAIHGFANAHELRTIRKKLYSTKLPKFMPVLESRPPVHKNELMNTWMIPFMGADRSVMLRTQRYLYEHENIRPAQVHTYQVVESLINIYIMALYFNMVWFFAKYEYGRKLLLKYPEFFTAGMFTQGSPPEEKLEKTKLILTFKGEGWDEQIPITEINSNKNPNKTMIATVSAIDPAYGMTSTIVALVAIVILTETDKLPNRGGVYSPGAAFYKTSLMQQLRKNGLHFEIKSKL